MNAAMDNRTIVEWDKDDLDALGILKIDVLALGMLTAMSKSLKLLEAHYGERLTLASIPSEEACVYAMIQRADTVGVFQIESRAQMSMLPRLKPANFYDLVIEVAIVRPGPIQGDMVHPYLRRRQGLEPTVYPSQELEAVLGKTLGVPLFQEQAMKIAIVAAGFTPAEADKLRRAMATFRRAGTIQTFQVKMVEGMVARGYEREFAERCFRQIEGFGEYGFPESHAASFALIVYSSCWMKCRYPDVFAAAMLNAQPLGFYAPAQLVRDAREHGVEVREVDVNLSDWDCTLEALPSPAAREKVSPEATDEGDVWLALIRRRCATPPSPARGRRERSTPATPPWRRHPRDACGAAGPAADRRRQGGGDAAAGRAARRRLRFRARPVAALRPRAGDAGAARRRRRLPFARPRPPRGFVGGARPRPRRRPGRSAAVRAEPPRTRQRARRQAAADAARRPCRRGLSPPVAVAQSPSGRLHARPPRRARRQAQRGAGDAEERRPRRRRRAGAGAPAARHRGRG